MHRKTSADRSRTHTRHPSDLSTDFSRHNATRLVSDPTRHQSASHIRQMSSNDTSTIATRRGSHQSDTTSRLFDHEARSIRVRTSDLFGMKPNLKFKDNVQYAPMPDGRLPTLKGQTKSTFVDHIADELDTRQLRNVLDTDSRRRRRRQSTLDNRRQQRALRSNGHGLSDSRLMGPEAIVEIIKTAPVFDNVQSSIPNTLSNRGNLPKQNNLITGTPDYWHEVESTEPVYATESSEQEPGIILAGNRESFPDFAVLDRRDPVRDSNVGGFLTTAWTSLWRRASTARTRKELDVAHHRNKTLHEANLAIQLERRSEADAAVSDRGLVSGEAPVQKHLSSSSSVLYETLDDLTLVSPPIDRPLSRQWHVTPSADVPLDAFYDPRTNSGTNSRATHSRNFSRPTNDSRQEFRPQSIDDKLRTQSSISQTKLFSPLLSGDSFPRPDIRSSSVPITASPHSTVINMSSVSNCYSTPAQAAGLRPSLIGTNSRPHVDLERSSKSSALDLTNLTKPLLSREDDGVLRRSVPSAAYTEGRSTTPTRTTINSKSETAESPVYEAARKDVKDAIFSSSLSRGGLDGLHGDESESTIARDFEDESDYDKGIWRTGIGKPVQIINPAGQNGPRMVERPNIISSFPVPRRSSETRRNSGSSEVNLVRIESHRGEVESDEQPVPPSFVHHESYMTSVNSFYTATGHLTNESATGSRETLTQQGSPQGSSVEYC